MLKLSCDKARVGWQQDHLESKARGWGQSGSRFLVLSSEPESPDVEEAGKKRILAIPGFAQIQGG